MAVDPILRDAERVRIEQATAAPGELRVISGWSDRARRCGATRIVQDNSRRPAFVQHCRLLEGHAGEHSA